MADEDSELTDLVKLITDARPDDPVAQFVLVVRLRRAGPRLVREFGARARARASLATLARATGLSRGRLSEVCGPLTPEEAWRRKSAKTVGPAQTPDVDP